MMAPVTVERYNLNDDTFLNFGDPFSIHTMNFPDNVDVVAADR